MSSNENREFDLVIFGASGFTGHFVIRELLISNDEKPEEYKSLKWAVAGRNEKKVADTLAKVGAELKKDLSGIKIISADVNNEESLVSMAKRTRLVVNVVGPFQFYGRQVVKACVQCHTHHIDISGEPQYIEGMQVEYYKEAVDNRTLVISTCGVDSIPPDVGVDFLKRKFNGRVHSVETFMKNKPGPSGYKLNIGTFESAIYGVAHFSEVRGIQRRLYSEVLTEKLPKSSRRQWIRPLPFREDQVEGWNLVFPSCDRDVIQRTQAYNYQHFNEQPLQVQTYFTVQSFFAILQVLVMVSIFGVLSLFNFGRKLLTSYPEYFTFGAFSRQGPSRQQIDETQFEMLIKGKGWANVSGENEPTTPFDKRMTLRISAPDPAYRATSICIVQAGLTILKERDQMPIGGVLTPASAFRNTKFVDRLQSRNFKIEVISESP